MAGSVLLVVAIEDNADTDIQKYAVKLFLLARYLSAFANLPLSPSFFVWVWA